MRASASRIRSRCVVDAGNSLRKFLLESRPQRHNVHGRSSTYALFAGRSSGRSPRKVMFERDDQCLPQRGKADFDRIPTRLARPRHVLRFARTRLPCAILPGLLAHPREDLRDRKLSTRRANNLAFVSAQAADCGDGGESYGRNFRQSAIGPVASSLKRQASAGHRSA